MVWAGTPVSVDASSESEKTVPSREGIGSGGHLGRTIRRRGRRSKSPGAAAGTPCAWRGC